MAEVFLTTHGERHALWRAVDQDEHVLDILVQRRCDKHAAKQCFQKLLKGLTDVPRVMSTTSQKLWRGQAGEPVRLAPLPLSSSWTRLV